MTKHSVYQILDEELTDDRGCESRLQFETGPFPTKEIAQAEAMRLRKLYQGHYNFTTKPDTSS